MIYVIFLFLFIVHCINRTLNTLEHQQQALCYDLHILSQKIRNDESKIW